jgi:hypothetical protein
MRRIHGKYGLYPIAPILIILSLTVDDGSPVCRKEVLDSVLVPDNPSNTSAESALVPKGLGITQLKPDLRPTKLAPIPKLSGQQKSPNSSAETSYEEELEVNEKDIAVFKRVVQHIVHSNNSLSDPRSPQTIGSINEAQSHSSSTISDLANVETEQYHPFVTKYQSMSRDLIIYRKQVLHFCLAVS